VLMAIEEHGAGRQLVRVRLWPRYSTPAVMLIVLVAGLSVWARVDHAGVVPVLFGVAAGLLGLRALQEFTDAAAAARRALQQAGLDGRMPPSRRRQFILARSLRRRGARWTGQGS